MRKWQFFAVSWKRLTVSLSLIGSLALGTATYAYVSPEVLPDHPLYGVRTSLEQAELRIAVSPENKEKVQLKQLERHLQGGRLLTMKKHPQAIAQAQVVLNELARVAPTYPENPPADSVDNAEDMRIDLSDALELHREELLELTAIHGEVQDEDDQEFTRELLLDTVSRMEKNVKELRQKQRIKQHDLEIILRTKQIPLEVK